MTIDIKTVNVTPTRQTYGHIARRFGEDRPASRYEEAVLDVQATHHFHYRPTWKPEIELYDPRRTAIVMADWYELRDPRQYYYANYNIARAGMNQAVERNFDFVEKRGMLAAMDPAWRDKVAFYLLPLRHVEWGANMVMSAMAEAGYGTAITAPAIFSAADHLGMAQIITRIGLMLDDSTGQSLDLAKDRWMTAPEWQEVRRLVEDMLVIDDWFESFVAQALVSDATLHGLVYGAFDSAGQSKGAAALSLLCEFMSDWFSEHSRWVDAAIKRAAAESAGNREALRGWFDRWAARARQAVDPLARAVLGSADACDAVRDALAARAAKLGL